LAKAPKISRTKITGMRQDWQRQCLAYFEVGELEMGEAPPAPEMVPGAGGYGGPAEASPPVANVASVSVSSSYAPVVLGTNGLPAVSPLSLGTAHPAGTTATGSPGSTTPGRSDPSGVSGQTYPKVTLRPTTRGAFGIPYQTGTPGSVPSPARFGPFGGQAPEGPIRLQPAPARFGAFTTPVPQGVTGLKHARAKFGRFGTWTPTGPMFGAPFEPALPSISPPPTLPPPGTVGPSTSISPPPSILAPPLTPQGRIALPPRIPPPP
jgi:hypothetical protein